MNNEHVVCEVIWESDEVKFTWSLGGGSFPAYSLTRDDLTAFQKQSQLGHDRLFLLVQEIRETRGRISEAAAQRLDALMEIGHRLHTLILPDKNRIAHRVRKWLAHIVEGAGQVATLELVVVRNRAAVEPAACVPWNVVYDRDPGELDRALQIPSGLWITSCHSGDAGSYSPVPGGLSR